MSSFEVVNYKCDGTEITLTKDVVKRYLCKNEDISDEEFVLFAQLCKARNLNPFLREAYIVKYGNQANIFAGKDFFTKRAAMNPNFDGIEDGVIAVSPNGDVQYLDGTYVPDGYTLQGGWARVYIKNIKIPKLVTISLKEYQKTDRNGNVNSTWKSMPAVMINKCAKVQALREAFPLEFNGLYTEEEFNGREGEASDDRSRVVDGTVKSESPVNNEPADPMQLNTIKELVGANAELAQKLRDHYHFTKLKELTVSQASEIISALKKK